MISGHTVSLVIPCHNEAEGLKHLLPTIPKSVDEVIVVDNNSTDGTAAIARQYGAKVITETKPGYGHAYQAGLPAATQSIIVTMDGDGQYPVAAIELLVTALITKNLDFISASRFPMPPGIMTFTRRLGNFLLTTTAQILFGIPVKDTQSGMWIFWQHHLATIGAREGGMAFSEEIKMKAILQHLKFGEEHISYLPRVGASKLLPLKDGWENLAYLCKLRWEAR
jgi:hypothetical protein